MENKKITLKEKIITTPKERIVHSLIITVVLAGLIGLVGILLNPRIGINSDLFMPYNKTMPTFIAMFQQFDVFKTIFGGVITDGEDMYAVGASPILLTGFIAGCIALALVLVTLVCYRNKFIGKKLFNAFVITSIVLLLTAGILFLFRDFSVKIQYINTMEAAYGEKIPEEYIAKIFETELFDLGTTPVVYLVAQFVGVGLLTTGLIVENVRKY